MTPGSSTDRGRELMMGALDGELSPAEQTELDRYLADDATLRQEWEQMQRVKAVTGSVRLREPPPEVWERYWGSVYARIERGAGWILFSLGAIGLLAWNGWLVVADVLADSALPRAVKGAALLTIIGAATLFVSVAREKWFVHRSDPYKDVQR